MKPFPHYRQHDQMDCGPTLRRIDCGGQACGTCPTAGG